MKRTLKENIKDIKKITSTMPKTLNEMMEFEGNDPAYIPDEEEMQAPVEEPAAEVEPEEEPKPHSDTMDVKAFVDDIRKKSLKGMAQLADNPDDVLYDILKRIWQICDKAYNDQKQQLMQQQTQGQPQQGQQPQQPMN